MNTVKDDTNDLYIGQLAYFTNMGPLATTNPEDLHSHEEVTTAVIGIHGSGRDAGSYLCALIAAVGESGISGTASSLEEELLKSMEGVSTTQRDRHRRMSDNDSGSLKEEKRTLVIAPWFLAPSDGQPQSSSSTMSTTSSLPFLQWADRAPVSHTFRYGAESIPTSANDGDEEDSLSSSTTTISSYGAMDVLLETLCNKQNYPNLKRIVVAGHSAGGQFVHRWGLSSDSWCFGDNQEEGANSSTTSHDDGLPSIRIVAANPRSYAYLDKRRYFPTTDKSGTADIIISEQGKDRKEDDKDTLSPFNKLDFRLPTTSEFDDCQEYNQYCWGLQDNPNVPAPYISNNVKNDNTSLFCRYASRDVVYLSGQRDIKQLGNQICDEDGYQGPSRRERSERFYASLQVQGDEVLSSCQGSSGTKNKKQVHDRIVVQDVGHDHALIFQSKEGKEGMFSSSDPALN